jgi:ABC-type nitrate/sulfonate/bicarbonate transport system substrate-binding protein
MTTRRDFIAGGAAVALGATAGLPLAAFGQGAKPESNTLSLGFGIDPPFAPHIVAIQKGWFREAGFSDVKTKTVTSGNVAGEALVAGDIQLWTPGNLPPISMVHNGIPVVVVGTASVNWDVEKLTVRKDANVNTPEDLYKIKIVIASVSGARWQAICRDCSGTIDSLVELLQGTQQGGLDQIGDTSIGQVRCRVTQGPPLESGTKVAFLSPYCVV